MGVRWSLDAAKIIPDESVSLLDGAIHPWQRHGPRLLREALDDVAQRSVRLLSQLTRQVAIVQYPTLSRSTVRHIELVSLTPTRVMVILILSTGRVEQRLVELDAAFVDTDLAELRVAVNQASAGVQIAAAMGAETIVLGRTLAKRDDGLKLGATDYVSTQDRGVMKSLRGSFDLIVTTV